MRTAPRPALPALCLLLAATTLAATALFGCALPQAALEPSSPSATALAATAPAANATAEPALAVATPALPAAIDADALTQRLNALINDTDPDSADFIRLRAELASQPPGPDVPLELRLARTQALAFEPTHLRERWQRHQESLDNAAALYAENLPKDTRALDGATVLRRLGPALYLLRLPGGDSAFFASTRRLKNGAKLRGIPALEQDRAKPDRSKGDLVDELADQPRTFHEISKQEVRRLSAERAPVETRMNELNAGRGPLKAAIGAEVLRLDALARGVNAVLGPRLLPTGRPTSPAAVIRAVKRLGHTYSRDQYYRYALPVTGHAKVDATLKGYLEERKKDVLDLLRSTGVGLGLLRANRDRIVFKAFTASPRLLSIRFEELRDTGGAHPNQGFASFVFDLKTQARLGLGDLFTDTPAALAVLSELAARRLELVLDGQVLREGLAAKAENFSVFVIDGQDLVFTFPPYQVASYAEGPQTLRVPLCHPRLLPLLAPGLLEALGK